MLKAISDSYKDAYASLKELGYKPFTKSTKPPLLEEVLQQQLLSSKSFIYRGKEYSFSSYSIERALSKLKHAAAANYNEMYGLLRNGLTTREPFESDTIISTIQYIDWGNFNNNQFHIIRAYPCQIGTQKIILDMVLFVNGIPLVILDFSLLGSIALFQKFQLLNDKLKTGNTPISFAQLLISISPEKVEYNTTNAQDKQWPVWNEESGDDLEHRQERILTYLCAPANLLLLIKNYILVGKDIKRIARFHQKRAVDATLERIKTYQPNGIRRGGAILHPIGSGINITMTLLIQNIMRQTDILKPRILVVTDRIEINNQIQQVLSQFRQPATQATSVKHLMELLLDDSLITTTVINKFHQISINETDKNNTIELFILINASLGKHSSTYLHNLHQLFPKACYISFTSKPFQTGKGIFEGDHLIDLYSLDDTIENDVTVPIFYLDKILEVPVRETFLDTELAGPWKRSRQSFDETVVDIIASDIARHFCKHNKGTPFKSILVTASRPIAQKYKNYFDKLPDGPNHINTALLVSKDDLDIDSGIDSFTREGKNEEEYNKEIIQKLQSPSNELEILIICKQQLAGIDTSLINTLYIAKYMQSNQLMQYVFRINRKTKNKFSCLVVDYVDIQQSLEEAIDAWRKSGIIGNELRKPHSQHPQILKLTNRINILNQLKEYIENSVTELNTLPSLIPKKEMEELYLEKIHECDSILLNIKHGSEKLKQESQPFKERLNTHKNFLEEIKISKDIQPTASPLDPNVAPILQHDQLAILLYRKLQDIITKKGAVITDEKTASACMLWVSTIRGLFVRDWSSKAIRDITNFLEDSLLSFCNKNDTDFSFSEIDDLLDEFLAAVKDQIQ